MITFGLTRNPPTDIQSPFANAVSANATTKMGNMLDTSTTNDSAATRSRNNHIIHVKNAEPEGRKLEEVWEADEEISDYEGSGAVEAIGALFVEGGEVFEVGRDVGDGHERDKCCAEELK